MLPAPAIPNRARQHGSPIFRAPSTVSRPRGTRTLGQHENPSLVCSSFFSPAVPQDVARTHGIGSAVLRASDGVPCAGVRAWKGECLIAHASGVRWGCVCRVAQLRWGCARMGFASQCLSKVLVTPRIGHVGRVLPCRPSHAHDAHSSANFCEAVDVLKGGSKRPSTPTQTIDASGGGRAKHET